MGVSVLPPDKQNLKSLLDLDPYLELGASYYDLALFGDSISLDPDPDFADVIAFFLNSMRQEVYYPWPHWFFLLKNVLESDFSLFGISLRLAKVVEPLLYLGFLVSKDDNVGRKRGALVDISILKSYFSADLFDFSMTLNASASIGFSLDPTLLDDYFSSSFRNDRADLESLPSTYGESFSVERDLFDTAFLDVPLNNLDLDSVSCIELDDLRLGDDDDPPDPEACVHSSHFQVQEDSLVFPSAPPYSSMNDIVDSVD